MNIEELRKADDMKSCYTHANKMADRNTLKGTDRSKEFAKSDRGIAAQGKDKNILAGSQREKNFGKGEGFVSRDLVKITKQNSNAAKNDDAEFDEEVERLK